MTGKAELVNRITDSVEGLTETQAQQAFDVIFEMIADVLSQGDSVKIPGFGTFTVAEKAARKGRNPATGDARAIETGKSVRFKAGELGKQPADPLKLFATTYQRLRA
jgi:DNA-binding protein HU-beta